MDASRGDSDPTNEAASCDVRALDASAFQQWELVEHRPTSGRDEHRPLRQLSRGQFASFPDRSGGIHDEVATVIPAHENQVLVRKDDVTAVTGKQSQAHGDPPLRVALDMPEAANSSTTLANWWVICSTARSPQTAPLPCPTASIPPSEVCPLLPRDAPRHNLTASSVKP